MKFIKKICVYLLVGLLTCSSIIISYEKANTCKAIEIGIGIGLGIVTVALTLYGAYYVSDPDNQEEIKESLSNYKNMTVEGAKVSYELNKKLFNDFVDYATSKGGGSAAVYTTDGRSYSVNEMAAAGFPEFDDWDKEMKKQGDSSSGGFGSIWDKLSFGVELLDFIRGFFNDNNVGFDTPDDHSQYYYIGDDGYINRETGEVNAFLFSDRKWHCSYDDYYPTDTYRFYYDYNYGVGTDKRIAVFVWTGDNSPHSTITYTDESGKKYTKYYRYKAGLFAVVGSIGSTNVEYLKGLTSYSARAYVGIVDGYAYRDITYSSTAFFRTYYSCLYDDVSNSQSKNIANWDYVSSNLPIFDTYEHAKAYIENGSLEGLLNGVPTSVTATPEPTKADSPPTPVDLYCKYFNGKSVTPANVVNVNYNIANEWDGTTENLTIILNGSTDVTPGITPTSSPVPTLPDQDGSNTTNNYIINITNILQPIQETVTNIYNFFIIDTEEISLEINNINTTPVTKFGNFVTTFGNLQTTFSNDTQDVLAAAGSTQRGISYPVLKVESPKILKDYVPDSVKLEQDGKTYIVLCDCSKYAVQFSMVRTLLKVILWFGFIFYLMKELKVVISLST